MTEEELKQYLIDDAKRCGEVFIGKLFHGTNNKKQKLTDESCFTQNYKTAKEYAFFWAFEAFEEELGAPYILIVEGKFMYVGSPDEYKLIKGKVIKKVILK